MGNDVTLEGKVCMLVACTDNGEQSLEVVVLKLGPYGIYVKDQNKEDPGPLTFFPWGSVSVVFEIDAQMRKDIDKRTKEVEKDMEALRNGWRRFGNPN